MEEYEPTHNHIETEFNCFRNDDETITIGETLFLEMCESWLELNGPKLFQKVLREKDQKPELKKKRAFYVQQ